MASQLNIGDHIIFIDAYGKERQALVTIVWDGMSGDESGCNLVIVHDDEARKDTYGRQIDRHTSVVHQSAQPAGGYCWKRPGV